MGSWCNSIFRFFCYGQGSRGSQPKRHRWAYEVHKLLSSLSPGSSGTALCSGALWGFGLPLTSTQLRYKLPATCSSTFFLNLSPLIRKTPQFPVIGNYSLRGILQYSAHCPGKLLFPPYRFPHHCPSALLSHLPHPIAIVLAQSLCLASSGSTEVFVEIAPKC